MSAASDDAAPGGLDSAPLVTISFSVGGWLQMYEYGVCQAFVESGFLKRLRDEGKKVRFCGSSAGALAATALASDAHYFEDMRHFAVQCGNHFRSSAAHLFRMKEYLAASIERFGSRRAHTERAESEVVAQISDGSLEIYVTVLPKLQRRALTKFADLDEVSEALLASCCMVPLVGLPFRLSTTQEWVADGGIRAFQPRAGEPNTLTVSPFYFSDAHIHPTAFIPAWWGLRPPPAEQHNLLFTRGFNDAISYLVRNRLVQPSCVQLLRDEAPLPTRSWWTVAKDVASAAFYVLVLRVAALVLVYVELWAVSLATFFGSLVMSGGSWAKCYEALRNIISPRVLLRLLLSARIPINESRLRRRSFVYRFFAPFVFTSEGVRESLKRRKRGKKSAVVCVHDANSNGGDCGDALDEPIDDVLAAAPGKSSTSSGTSSIGAHRHHHRKFRKAAPADPVAFRAHTNDRHPDHAGYANATSLLADGVPASRSEGGDEEDAISTWVPLEGPESPGPLFSPKAPFRPAGAPSASPEGM